MSAPLEPYYAPLGGMADMQKLESHDRDSLSKAGLRKRHWRSWSTGERLLLAVSVCMALLLVSLSGFILNRTDNKLVITTDPKLLSHAKFVQGAWLTLQSFCVMALMLPVWNCVTTIKSEVSSQSLLDGRGIDWPCQEWIRMVSRSPSVLVKHVNAASATPTSAFNSLAYGHSRHASPLFRCALLVSALAFAASSTSHGLLFLNIVKVGQPANIEIAVLGDGAVYRYAELVGSARRADGPFDEESAVRSASLMYLSRVCSAGQASSSCWLIRIWAVYCQPETKSRNGPFRVRKPV